MSNNTRDFLVLDGGVATQLEARGHDLNDALWSARLLHERPEEIEEVHLDFLRAGADIICSASYQATFEGFVKLGLHHSHAADLIRRSVQLCMNAAKRFVAEAGVIRTVTERLASELNSRSWISDRLTLVPPLIAASVGPYGAYLANGAEYTGDYDLDESGLVKFHRERFELLADSRAELMLCETVPSFSEARALAKLADEKPCYPTWISFSCRDDERISDGTPIAECAKMLEQSEFIQGIGINCTPPGFISDLIERIRVVSDLPIMVYPNSGESYNAVTKRWSGTRDPADFAVLAKQWRERGAQIIGGCCRTGPEHIRALAECATLE